MNKKITKEIDRAYRWLNFALRMSHKYANSKDKALHKHIQKQIKMNLYIVESLSLWGDV